MENSDKQNQQNLQNDKIEEKKQRRQLFKKFQRFFQTTSTTRLIINQGIFWEQIQMQIREIQMQIRDDHFGKYLNAENAKEIFTSALMRI